MTCVTLIETRAGQVYEIEHPDLTHARRCVRGTTLADCRITIETTGGLVEQYERARGPLRLVQQTQIVVADTAWIPE
jgi:hypothetical protein